MGIVIAFRRRRHARASSDCAAARASNVMCEQPISPASRTSPGQRCAGIPRLRQELTVWGSTPSFSETAPVPPRSSTTLSGVSMDPNIVRRLRTRQGFSDRETTFADVCGPLSLMTGPQTDPPNVIGPRLKALREALGFESQIAFAKKIGVEKNTYNPWEKGTRPLTFEGALLIRKRFRIPLEYLFFGEFADELPYRVREALDRAV